MKNVESFKIDGVFRLLLSFVFCCIFVAVHADSRNSVRKQLFDDGWSFHLGDTDSGESVGFDDSKWRLVDLPHDWSIEGNVDEKNPSGNDGGYYPTGVAWYRKTFAVPKDCKEKKFYVYFEGVYMDSEVFVNGKSLGRRPYGYSSFIYDMTPLLKFEGENVIAVRVDNSKQKNCRWYSGSGIYRHVWLMMVDPVHVEHWGVAVTTPEVSSKKALVKIKSLINNETDTDKQITLRTTVTRLGKKCSNSESRIVLPAGDTATVVQNLNVENPDLWSVDEPNLYNAEIEVLVGDEVADCVSETFGIRSISYSAEKGLLLNGKRIIINGGCVHHDNGVLGAASYDRAEIRKAQLMKMAGFNAVRTSHNIPSEAFLNACDSIGLLVIDEAFDGWRGSKNKYDYSMYFDKWWKKDVESMVLRDRNHPSVFCWSIGNEVIERKKIEVVTTARKLADHIRIFDSTRPITSALASWDSDWEIYDPLAAVHDIVGYNYMIHHAPSDHQRVPSRVMMQTESYPREAFANWKMSHDNIYVIGDFVWTAIDYLGESGIGRFYYEGETEGEHYSRNQYPWHGAYCGDIDLTGWRKPISYYREILYGNTPRKLYMAVKEPSGYYGKIKETQWSVWPTWECWNWPGHEGRDIQVEVYSRCESVKLYLNGRLVEEKPTGMAQEYKAVFSIPYEAGEIKAVGLDNGKVVEEHVLRTAGKASRIRLTADSRNIEADGQDLSFITVEIVDKDGLVVPDAENRLSFELKGPGRIVAVGNANLKDTDCYISNNRKAWKGRAIVVVRSNGKKGKIKLNVKADGLKGADIMLNAK